MIRMEERWRKLSEGAGRGKLETLYGTDPAVVAEQAGRRGALLKKHAELFGEQDEVLLVSAPGRTEIGGNHTDHNHGRVLAASVNLDILCAASPRADRRVRFDSEGHRAIEISLDDLGVQPEEEGKTEALIRGVAAGMEEAGCRIGGFDATVTSTVARGSGLSSSAALEVMVTGVLDAMYNDFGMPYVQRATISQMAENRYFGKPSGLLDQMASAAGGLVTVDFRSPGKPEVRRLQYDFAEKGYRLVVVATGGSHADLTADYAAIPAEMKQVAACFGQEVLRGITMEQLIANAGEIRKRTSDRALMRAMHFVREDERVPWQVKALEEDRIRDFLDLIVESGRSSFMYLQNVFADNRDQSLSLALAMAEDMLRGEGAWRIHGGGFAGTTLNFVPEGKLAAFVDTMENTFGRGTCSVLNIRPEGAAYQRL